MPLCSITNIFFYSVVKILHHNFIPASGSLFGSILHLYKMAGTLHRSSSGISSNLVPPRLPSGLPEDKELSEFSCVSSVPISVPNSEAGKYSKYWQGVRGVYSDFFLETISKSAEFFCYSAKIICSVDDISLYLLL